MNENARREIGEWAAEIEQYEPIKWDRLPELQLYMDQVIVFMEKQLNICRRNAQSKTLTPSMINNYVKEEILDRPVNKRYDRAHLAQLMMISMLKPVLTISDISELLHAMASDSADALYGDFSRAQTEAVHSVGARLSDLFQSENAPADRAALAKLAMELGLQANAYRIASEKMLETLAQITDDSEAWVEAL